MAVDFLDSLNPHQSEGCSFDYARTVLSKLPL